MSGQFETSGVPALTGAEQELVDAARDARAGAYAPYSRFRVGAALRTDDGTVFTGANVENAAYPATICAERVAVSTAVTRAHRTFVTLAVMGTGPGICTPCGLCRQVLHEFAPDLVVLAAGETGMVERFLLGRDLLPHGFTGATLEGL